MIPVVLMAIEATLLGGSLAPDAELDAALALVARRTIVFGHQSVGAGIVEGLGRQARARSAPLRIVEARAGAPLERGTLAHAYLAQNGDPLGKLAAFEALLAATESAPPDVAIFKLCWADFVPGTDVDQLFAAYQATFDRLARRFPGTAFLHVTTPLTTVQGGPRAMLKRLLGKAPYGELENARREAFNDLLRARPPGGALLDLARLEAEEPRGGLATHPAGGKAVLALAATNTDDGGHLNPAAQDRVARAMVLAIARLSSRRP